MKAIDRIELCVRMMNLMWGTAYRWGGDDPLAGFDCSGGVIEILRSVGVLKGQGDLTAQGLHDLFSKPEHGVVIDINATPGAGCLIFYGASSKQISHVGMSFNGVIMFEFGGGDSKTVNLENAIRQNAYGRFRPITNRKDLVGFVLPNLLRSS